MTQKVTAQQLKVALDEPIPADKVASRRGAGNMTLSYLEGWYVIDRLNKVIGQLNWGYDIVNLDVVSEGEFKDNYGKEKFRICYRAVVRLVVYSDTGPRTFTEVGYGHGIDKSPGMAHESAGKEAATDGLKRCAKNLGMSCGLALYDKAQENVIDINDAPVKKTTTKAKPKAKAAKSTDLTKTLAIISETAAVIASKQIMTPTQILDKMEAEYKVRDKAKLTAVQAEAFLTFLNQTLKGDK